MQGTQELRRSLSLPQEARRRRLATQALIQATERGDAPAVRKLVLQAGAELTGCRALNRFGCDPVQALALSSQLTPEEQARVRHQFAELPQLTAAAGGARRGVETLRATAAQKAALQTDSVRFSCNEDLEEDATFLPSKLGFRGPYARSELALTTLASSVKLEMQEKVYAAAVLQPKLLRMPPELASRSLPALATVLKNEDLAIRTVTLNPRLLACEALRLQKILPALTGVLGGQEEAAYAAAVRPELLQVERPQQLRDLMKVMADCLSSIRDAGWLVLQSIVPPSVKVTARPWCYEEILGEYIRIEGVEALGRPVYCKPASSLKHMGDKARDLYLLYSTSPCRGCSAGWRFTPHFDRRRTGPKAVPSDEAAFFGGASSARNSPDQVAAGTWHMMDSRTGTWELDHHVQVQVQDGNRRKGPGLLSAEPSGVRRCFNLLREGLGLVWREAGADGVPPEGTLFVGSVVGGDPVHPGGALGGRYAEMQDFAAAKGATSVQLEVGRDPSLPIKMTAWEPIVIYLMYCDPGEHPGDLTPQAAEQQRSERRARLLDAGFRPPCSSKLKPPVLEGCPQVQEVFQRCYPRGNVEVLAPNGTDGRPPLLFIKSQVCAQGASGHPCEAVKTDAGQALSFVHGLLPPVDAPVDASMDSPTFASVGEIGYQGFQFFRGASVDLHREVTEEQMRIDTAVPLKVVLAWFPCQSGVDGASIESVSLPGWVDQEGWKPFESRLPVALSVGDGQRVPAVGLRVREIEPGQTVIRGSGRGMILMAFWQQIGEARRDELRALLLRQPLLLASVDMVTLLLRRLRSELGDAVARRALTGGLEQDAVKWPELCQAGDIPSMETWILKRKLEALSPSLGGPAETKALFEQTPELKATPYPELAARCAVLFEAFGGQETALRGLRLEPRLLATSAAALRDAAEDLRRVFEVQQIAQLLTAHPDLLLLGGDLRAFFSQVMQRYPDVARQRFRQRTSGEWPCWVHAVGKASTFFNTWLGRIEAEERTFVCSTRVRSFGAHPAAGELSEPLK